MVSSRPTKPVFTVHINEGFTTPVEPSVAEFDDDDMLLDVDWSSEDSYATISREYFVPTAHEKDR